MSETKSERLPQRAMTEAVKAATVTATEDEAGRSAEAAAATVSRAAPPANANPSPGAADLLTVLDTTQAAFVRGAEAVADELAVLARSGVATAAEAAGALLGAKTLGDAIDIQAGFARKSIDTMLAGSTKLAEIGARYAAEALQPLATGAADRG